MQCDFIGVRLRETATGIDRSEKTEIRGERIIHKTLLNTKRVNEEWCEPSFAKPWCCYFYHLLLLSHSHWLLLIAIMEKPYESRHGN